MRERLDTRLRRARWVARARLSEHAVYLPLVRWRHGPRMLSADTELVVDGFTRGASVYATIALQLAQPRPLRLAHVLHAPALVIAAARRGLPVLVTIREPRASVLSCIVREPYVTPSAALEAYCRFYERLLPWRSSFVVGDFPRVTGDLASVVADLNRRFGTSFAPFEESEENRRRAFQLIEDRTRRPAWDGWIGHFMTGRATWDELAAVRAAGAGPSDALNRFEERAARPSRLKEARKRTLAPLYDDDPRLAALRARAAAVYARLVEPPARRQDAVVRRIGSARP